MRGQLGLTEIAYVRRNDLLAQSAITHLSDCRRVRGLEVEIMNSARDVDKWWTWRAGDVGDMRRRTHTL